MMPVCSKASRGVRRRSRNGRRRQRVRPQPRAASGHQPTCGAGGRSASVVHAIQRETSASARSARSTPAAGAPCAACAGTSRRPLTVRPPHSGRCCGRFRGRRGADASSPVRTKTRRRTHRQPHGQRRWGRFRSWESAPDRSAEWRTGKARWRSEGSIRSPSPRPSSAGPPPTFRLQATRRHPERVMRGRPRGSGRPAGRNLLHFHPPDGYRARAPLGVRRGGVSGQERVS